MTSYDQKAIEIYCEGVKIVTIDIRDNKSLLISFHMEGGKEVFQVITEEVTIILNREQMERLGYC